mmetsp:Transcript_314/g.410  ORF Transcript_314/g.410 Transcript_314/m.410 type:complete len:172 (+) Transcript_314:922-1437(+)
MLPKRSLWVRSSILLLFPCSTHYLVSRSYIDPVSFFILIRIVPYEFHAAALLYFALTHSPEPLTDDYLRALSWEAATERFEAAGSISTAEAEALSSVLSAPEAGVEVSQLIGVSLSFHGTCEFRETWYPTSLTYLFSYTDLATSPDRRRKEEKESNKDVEENKVTFSPVSI